MNRRGGSPVLYPAQVWKRLEPPQGKDTGVAPVAPVDYSNPSTTHGPNWGHAGWRLESILELLLKYLNESRKRNSGATL